MPRIRKRNYDDPLRHPDHSRPRTRREFLAQGFILGGATLLGSATLSLAPGKSIALSPDLQPLIDDDLLTDCSIKALGAGKVPFICFDLAGGSNQAGSNVLVGQRGGQLDFLTTAGYERQGLPGDMIPPIVNPATRPTISSTRPWGSPFTPTAPFCAA